MRMQIERELSQRECADRMRVYCISDADETEISGLGIVRQYWRARRSVCRRHRIAQKQLTRRMSSDIGVFTRRMGGSAAHRRGGAQPRDQKQEGGIIWLRF